MKGQMFRKLRKDNRGIAGIALALVLGLIVIAIVLPIGLWIQSAFEGTFRGPAGAGGHGWINNSGSLGFNTTIESIWSNSLSGYSLGSILPIIFAAGAIIAAIVGFMAFRKGGEGGF